MTSLQSTPPASLRSGSPAVRSNRSGSAPDPRPYLITGPRRKAPLSAQQYLSLFPHEAEDARLTGSTRSLYRRLLALNLPGSPDLIEASQNGKSGVVESIFGRKNSKIA